MPALTGISPDKLGRLVGTPAASVLVDIRPADDLHIVPGSVRRPSAGVASWSAPLRGRAVVVIDEDGATAQAVAAWLRSEGTHAEVLDGGMAAWRAAGLPLVDTTRLPPRDEAGRTVWVTRARPKVDRIACPWLIRRFVDPGARFLFVPPGDVLITAAQLGAEPFDIVADTVFWTHRGEQCTFDAMVDAFGLGAFEPLAYLATIVRGADTDRLDLVPEAAGLLAVSLGLSRWHANDLAQLEAGMIVYDALFRWCRDARDERHGWTSHRPRTERSA